MVSSQSLDSYKLFCPVGGILCKGNSFSRFCQHDSISIPIPTRVGEEGGGSPRLICVPFSSRYFVPTRVWEEVACLLLRAYPRRRGRGLLICASFLHAISYLPASVGGERRWLAFYCIPTRVGGGGSLRLICASFLHAISYLPASEGEGPTNLCSLFFTLFHTYPRRWGRTLLICARFSSRHCIPTRVCGGSPRLICAPFSSRHCVPTRVGEEGLVFYFIPTRVREEGLPFTSYLPASVGGGPY